MRMQKGFTLTELMITLVIAAVALTVAVPAARTMQANNRVVSAANDLVNDLKAARSATMIGQRNMTFTAIDGTVPTNVWGKAGWRLTDAQGGVVLQMTSLPSTVTIAGTPSDGSFVFTPKRITQAGVGGAVINMSFKVCDSSVTNERGVDVSINQFGRILYQRHATTTPCNT